MVELEAANSGKILIIGHRGAMGHAPENTMASFQRGLDLGADLVELDVHMSRDGALVVMHDSDVSRTTDGEGVIAEMDLAAIKRLDAGSWFDGRYRAERVPELSEVLDWARGRVPLSIEIKGDPRPSPGIEQAVVAELRAHRMTERVMVISFFHDVMKRVKEAEPSVATGMIYAGRLVDTAAAARAAMADSVRPHWAFWTAELVREVHAAGLHGNAWTVNDERTASSLADMGVDSIATDYPDRLRALVDRLGRSG